MAINPALDSATPSVSLPRKRMALWLKIVLGIVVVLVLIFAIGTAIGGTMPPTHTTTSSVTIHQPVAVLWEDLVNVEAYPRWRPEVEAVKRHAGTTLKWDEDWGMDEQPVTLTATTVEAPNHLVLTIDDNQGMYSGSWEFVLTPDGDGTRVVVTEQGTINDPFTRFAMVRVAKCTDYCLNLFLKGLAKKHGETAVIG